MTAPGLAEVADFLYREAALLEAGRLDEWVGLFDDDCLYWVPSNAFDTDPRREVSIVYDDAPRLRERVTRITSGSFWAQDPPSRTTRLVSNIRLLQSAAEECVVEARLLVVELRRGHSQVLSGRTVHTLRRAAGDGWRIKSKVVYLIQNNEPLQNLTFLV